MDPGRFRSGRWFLRAEGVLVSAFGIAGLVSAALHPHAGPTGAPILGLAATPAQSAILLGLGVVAGIAAAGRRRAAITVTAVSAVAYTLLLFFGSVATARARPTPLGFHAADIVLHGVLAAVNFALLMWLIPDELGDEIWVPRRDRDRGQARRADRKAEASPPAAAAPAQQIPSQRSPAEATPPPSSSKGTDEPVARHVENSTPTNHFHARATGVVLSRGVVPAAMVLAAAVGVIVWLRRR
ncbi:DUF4383 domain-containing protein [Mycobacterium paraffinicum]|uniref:DUF4383 domain-containing protein n=1 Tax=Mycobacterium paraffinicum TaxID=53378 RepID=UPI00142E811D|nr:DUF4383 domain-containing protein [Mycobacterium paraffinicum]